MRRSITAVWRLSAVVAALFAARFELSSANPPRKLTETPSSDIQKVARGDAVVAEPPDERKLSDVFQLELLPETTKIAPVQPLYLRVRLTNLLDKRVAIPAALSGDIGLALLVSDDRQQHAFLTEAEPFGRGKTLGPREYVDWHAVACIDFHPLDPRRSPRRVFDLDGDYGLHVSHPCDPNDDERRLCSDMVTIKVRKPADDEQAAGKIFSRGNLAPPLHAGKKAALSESLIPELRAFLDRHSKSVFADDVRWLLAKQVELVRDKLETQKDRDAATVEFLEQLVKVDPQRVSMRRMIYFAKRQNVEGLEFRPSLTEALSNPDVQRLIDVRKIVKQLRESPPYFPDDKDLGQCMEKGLTEVQESLLGQ